jgi:ADP-ribose pyrophosphatase
MSTRIKNRSIKWQGDAWRLQIVRIEAPDGRIVEKGVIEHPGSVVIVPLMGDQVLMLRQYRLSLDEVILELPAGTREHGEDWLACAQREIREESGYRADNWHSLGHLWPAPGLTDEEMAVFLATDLTAAPLEADFDEEIEVVPYQLAELTEMALDGRLQDAKSVVAILRTADYLEKRKR